MKKLFIFTIFLVLCPQILFALNLSGQRDLYAKTVKLQNTRNWQKANKKILLLSKYPLVYLLKYKYLKTHFDVVSTAKINQFIKDNSKTSARDDLQRAYLYYLANNKRWDDYLIFYPKRPRTIDLRCFHFEAEISQGNSSKAWNGMRKLWLTGNSLPNGCNVVINHYINNGQIGQQLIWQRFQLAFKENQIVIMSHLANLLRGKRKALAKNVIVLNKHLSYLLTSPIFISKKSDSFPFLLTLIKRLSRKNIEEGLKAYYLYDQKLSFTKKENKTLKAYFAVIIIQGDKTNYFKWLDTFLGDLNSDNLIEQRLRFAIRFNNWKDINHWISELSPKSQKHARWEYWKARLLERKNKHRDANKIYSKLAKKRSYYGFLSAQKMGLKYKFNEILIAHKSKILPRLEGVLAQIEELNYQGDHDRLKKDWELLLKKSDTTTKQQLGLYAFNKGWIHLSILASIRSKSWNAFNIRFPKVPELIFAEQATKYSLDRTYIYAIARQESSFDEVANSPAGAKGYMQIMPYTAKFTAKKIGLKKYSNVSQLHDGNINVELGSAYFAILLKRYNGNRVLATAAYNAGPQRVDRWKQGKKGRDSDPLPMDSWIEAIPYKETRDYVKNVLAYNVIYQHILKKSLQFFNSTELKARY
ncbi:MAG: transglycosylase SLT domain-containing protein [Psychromonas sp.]|nr:transglycosylase SLT domain-containing protein [Psychromonas sp.]